MFLIVTFTIYIQVSQIFFSELDYHIIYYTAKI